ncbi:hypothetical protein CJD36_014000 [Flavipsychrobacter stenotrophus]|uniref:histidine kinase n=1 Tax=Flavipsychrobacter stenotrophus TaxID=2077091 RepID=A0A2S7SWT8_9BACT|nr:ATP-binding protein [Flavipsychrobacter stenotrophus]PQJ11077.1 hypothetical protein CJD36_014000 [Flavipsychrobacter stenotrophus]
MLTLASCHLKDDHAATANISMDSAVIRADRMHDSGNKVAAAEYISNVHAHAGKLSVADEMKYVTYCNILYMDLGYYEKSIDLADSMLGILERNGLNKNPKMYMEIYNLKADALMAKGLYSEAYDYYYKAKVLAQTNADSCSFTIYNHSLGIVLYRQQKYLEAAQYFKQSFNQALYCNPDFSNFYLKQELLDDIGLCYGKLNMTDSAVLYYSKALKFIRENIDKFPGKPAKAFESAEAVVWGNMADVYIAAGRYDSAKTLLSNSIKVNLQKDYTNSDAELSQIKLANIYLETKQLPELKILLEDIRAELDTIPSRVVEIKWNWVASKYYEQRGDSVKAYKHLVDYINKNDSFIERNKALMSSDIEGRLKNQERQYQIFSLQKNKKQDEMWLVIALVIIVMAVIIIFLVLRYSSRVSKDMRSLTALNEKVNEKQQQLEIALKEVEFRDKDKSRILRSVAHDVMSPISAISALTDILIGDSADRPEEELEMLRLINEACNNSLNLSKDILEAAETIAPGNMHKEMTDVNKLVISCVELLNARAHVKQQNITVVSYDENIQAFIHKDKIWRVFNNLIVNAIKFSYENTTIAVKISKVADNVVVSINDTGMGIPEKNKHHIFDMFTESKMYGTCGEKPHGIGLAISLQVVRAHDGEIWFESVEGRGTTFYVSLPLKVTNS